MMRRMKLAYMQRLTSAAAAFVLTGLLVGASPVWALSANFDLVQNLGFDSSGLPAPGLVVDALVPLLSAGDESLGSFNVGLSGTSDVCILASGSNTCSPTVVGVSGPFSVLVSITVASINDPSLSPTQPFTLVLGDLTTTGGVPFYSKADVSIDLDYAAIPGLDTSAVPAFNYDPNRGVNGFSPFTIVEDRANAPSQIFTFIGWKVMLGDTVTFRYDVNTSPNPAGTPQLAAAAYPVVVPEPGTALLLGLGLVGLARAGRR